MVAASLRVLEIGSYWILVASDEWGGGFGLSRLEVGVAIRVCVWEFGLEWVLWLCSSGDDMVVLASVDAMFVSLFLGVKLQLPSSFGEMPLSETHSYLCKGPPTPLKFWFVQQITSYDHLCLLQIKSKYFSNQIPIKNNLNDY